MPEEILETPQPAQPTASTPTGWLKIILAAIVGLALLAASAYAGYWYGSESAKVKTQSAKPQPKTQTPTTTTPEVDETAGWKTYVDNNNGYSFRYPSGLVERNGSIYTELPTMLQRPDTNLILSTSVFEKIELSGLKPSDSVGTRKEVADKTYEEVIQKVILDGKAAVKIRQDVLPGSQTERVPGTFVRVVLGEKILSIWISDTSKATLNDYGATFDQILSTFRFLE